MKKYLLSVSLLVLGIFVIAAADDDRYSRQKLLQMVVSSPTPSWPSSTRPRL